MDISKDFAAFCTNELGEFGNVSVHVMDYADFSMIRERPTKIYAHGVFIHFNFYDMSVYLRNISPGGRHAHVRFRRRRTRRN